MAFQKLISQLAEMPAEYPAPMEPPELPLEAELCPETEGMKAERAAITWALTWRRLAAAVAMFWLALLSWPIRAFSLAS